MPVFSVNVGHAWLYFVAALIIAGAIIYFLTLSFNFNYYSRTMNANTVLPAKAGIQNSTGWWIKSGMTNVNMSFYRSNNSPREY
jgi:hypothetical protein